MSNETETNSSLETLLDGSAPAETAETSVESAGNVETPEGMGEKPTDAAPPAAEAPNPEDGFLTDGEKAALVAQARDERRKRQEYEKQLSEMQLQIQALQQPKPQPQEQEGPTIDWWADPETAAATLQQQMQRAYQQEIYRTRVVMSDQIMRRDHPDYDEVTRAFGEEAKRQYEAGNPYLVQQLTRQDLPGKFAYEEGRKILAMREIGEDPVAYKERLRQELLNEQAGLQTQQAPKAPAPKSLAGATSTQQRDPKSGRYAPSGPASLEELLD